MENIRQYLITVTAAATIAAIINSILGKKGTCAAVVKVLTGLFVAISVISPLLNIKIEQTKSFAKDLEKEAQYAISAGESAALSSVEEIISNEVSAYILDKANTMGLDIEVEVFLNDGYPPQPYSVTIKGDVSPYAKEILGQYIKDNLGIRKEDQKWL